MDDEKCVRDPRHDCFGLQEAAAYKIRYTARKIMRKHGKFITANRPILKGALL